MRLPVWLDTSVEYTEVRNSWPLEASHVLISGETTLSALVSSDSNVLEALRHVNCDISLVSDEEGCLAAVALLARAKNLQSIRFVCSASEAVTRALAETLLLLPHLRQLCIITHRKFWLLNEAILKACATMSQLTAIYLDFRGMTTHKMIDLLCAALHQNEQLLSFEFACVVSAFHQIFWNRMAELGGLQRLQLLRCYQHMFLGADAVAFTSALSVMPNVQDLFLQFHDDQSVLTLTDFFRKAGQDRSFKCIELCWHYGGALSLYDLFVAMKDIPIYRLVVSDMSGVKESEILESGWVCEIVPINGEQAKLAAKNKKRHLACFRTCARLIAIRKSKRALTTIALDIVLIIAKMIWGSRNLKVWDTQSEEKNKEGK